MRSPRRLRAGLGAALVLGAACWLLPALLGDLPAADPVRAALLPPGTRVTAVTLTDGSTLTSPEVSLSDQVVTVGGGAEPRRVARDLVAAVRTYRLWLGSDRFGRDLLRQVLRGGRVSLAIAILALAVSLLIGGAVGTLAATGGQLVDGLLMRTVDALLAFPVLFLMILAATLFRPSPLLLVVLLGATSWMGLARLVRGQLLSLRSRQFVLAATTSGSRRLRTVRLHYLPNLAGPVSQDAALRMADLIIAEATLSFLGIGVPPTVPTWGSLIADGQRTLIDGWWLAVIPGLAIAWLVISLALIGDGLQQLGEP